jgi:hypothetical protein
MKYIIALSGILFFALCVSTGVYAQQSVNFICKNDCLSKSKTLGECNALCSTTDEAGNPTKDTNCVSSCTSKGGTYYNCYSLCDGSGGTGDGTQGQAPASNTGGKSQP